MEFFEGMRVRVRVTETVTVPDDGKKCGEAGRWPSLWSCDRLLVFASGGLSRGWILPWRLRHGSDGEKRERSQIE